MPAPCPSAAHSLAPLCAQCAGTCSPTYRHKDYNMLGGSGLIEIGIECICSFINQFPMQQPLHVELVKNIPVCTNDKLTYMYMYMNAMKATHRYSTCTVHAHTTMFTELAILDSLAFWRGIFACVLCPPSLGSSVGSSHHSSPAIQQA